MGVWQCIMRVYLEKKLSITVLTYLGDSAPIELALDLENVIIGALFDLPEQVNYMSAYFEKPKHNSKAQKVEHLDFPNAKKQNPLTDTNPGKYLGSYYSYEMDTHFDIFSDAARFQMKYTGKDDDSYINLLDFSDDYNIKARTNGDWGGDCLPIAFYGSEDQIDFFVLQEGCGHFYFIKCTK